VENTDATTYFGSLDDATLTAVAEVENQTDDIGVAGAGLTAAGLSASGVRTAVGLASANLDTQLGDLPTNSELSTALGTADDAVLAAIAALENLSAEDLRDLVIEDQGSTISLGCALAAIVAYAAGDVVTVSGTDSTYEDPSGAETRIEGVAPSAGNRSATITCPTY